MGKDGIKRYRRFHGDDHPRGTRLFPATAVAPRGPVPERVKRPEGGDGGAVGGGAGWRG